MDLHLLVYRLILAGEFCSEVSLLTSFLANGKTKGLVGKITAKPINHALINFSRNPAVHPVVTETIVKLIAESKAIVMNSAINKP